MQDKIIVGMGKFMVSKPPFILQSLGLGSCVGACLYDPKNQVGGLAHIMAPKSHMEEETKPMRFADKAITMMVENMLILGAEKHHMVAKLIGGASMFPNVTKVLEIGNENILAVRKQLEEENIKIVAEEVGGNHGRSIWFDLKTGDVVISTSGKQTKTI